MSAHPLNPSPHRRKGGHVRSRKAREWRAVGDCTSAATLGTAPGRCANTSTLPTVTGARRTCLSLAAANANPQGQPGVKGTFRMGKGILRLGGNSWLTRSLDLVHLLSFPSWPIPAPDHPLCAVPASDSQVLFILLVLLPHIFLPSSRQPAWSHDTNILRMHQG